MSTIIDILERPVLPKFMRMRWLRRVWPPLWVVFLCVFPGIVIEGAILYDEWSTNREFFADGVHLVTLMFAILVAGGYGVYRVAFIHPMTGSGYYEWLRTTPWTRGKPLPFGPVHLVWQDALFVGMMIALNTGFFRWWSLLVAAAFCFVYLLALLVIALVATGEKYWGFALGFGLGFPLLYMYHLSALLVALVLCYGVAYMGLRASFARFPWADEKRRKILSNSRLGWFYDHLGPTSGDILAIGSLDAFLVAALVGWWVYVVNQHFYDPVFNGEGVSVACAAFVAIGAGARLGLYCVTCWPPITLLGRLASGRLIIPAYDCVFIAPLVALLVAGVSRLITVWTPWDASIVVPIALGLSLWILLGIGPTRRHWHLTGEHRIVADWLYADAQPTNGPTRSKGRRSISR